MAMAFVTSLYSGLNLRSFKHFLSCWASGLKRASDFKSQLKKVAKLWNRE